MGHRRTGGRLGGQPDPVPAPYRPDLLQEEFAELTARAEELVAESTGLRSAAGPARARVTDRAGWVSANIASFQRLLGPHLDRLDPTRLADSNAVLARLAGPAGPGGRAATGAQMGVVLGWLSTRVLGQYDLLLTEEAADDQDLVYFVGPNVVALEAPARLRAPRVPPVAGPPRGHPPVPVHGHPLDARLLRVPGGGGDRLAASPTRGRLAAPLRRDADEIRAGTNPLDDNGVLGLVATPEQLEGIHRIQALMSLLEGHGDVTMDRAGAAAIPSAAALLPGAAGSGAGRPTACPACSSS